MWFISTVKCKSKRKASIELQLYVPGNSMGPHKGQVGLGPPCMIT